MSEKQPPADVGWLTSVGFEKPESGNGAMLCSQKNPGGVRLWVYSDYSVGFGTDQEVSAGDLGTGPGVIKNRQDYLDLLRLYKIPTERPVSLAKLKSSVEHVRQRFEERGELTRFDQFSRVQVRDLLAYIDALEKEKRPKRWHEVQVIDYWGRAHGVVSDKDGVLVIGSRDNNQIGTWAHNEEPLPGKWLEIQRGHTRYIVTADEKPSAG